MDIRRIVRNIAILGDVPDRPVARMFGIGVVSASLVIDRHSIQGDEDGVNTGREDGWPDVEHVHDALDQHQKHREHNDDDVVVGDTTEGQLRL